MRDCIIWMQFTRNLIQLQANLQCTSFINVWIRFLVKNKINWISKVMKEIVCSSSLDDDN